MTSDKDREKMCERYYDLHPCRSRPTLSSGGLRGFVVIPFTHPVDTLRLEGTPTLNFESHSDVDFSLQKEEELICYINLVSIHISAIR